MKPSDAYSVSLNGGCLIEAAVRLCGVTPLSEGVLTAGIDMLESKKGMDGMRFIGITGGIGAGKSEVLNYIREHYKCVIYLADEVAHLVEQPGTEAFGQLVELLGQDVLGAGGEIDRVVMADRIFANPALLEQVNGIIHPAVREFLLERLAQVRESGEAELFFVEAALLIECGYLALVDEMWYIYADEQVRRERLKASRGYSEEKISQIMAKQLTEQRFRESCDFVIDNSGNLAESYRQIDERLGRHT